MRARGALVVFAKAPRPGLVKTRMSPPFTSEQAAGLYGAMLDDVMDASRQVARELGLDPVVAVHPPDADWEIAARGPAGVRVVRQRGRDLSERMTWAVGEAAAGGARFVLIRGSDSPALSAAAVGQAVEALENADVAIAPDLDGGYNLVALRSPVPGLFGHPMSTESVLDDTVAAAESQGCRVHILEESFDLDRASDLALLARCRDRIDPFLCRRTLAFLDGNDLWRHVPGVGVGGRPSGP